MRIVVGVDEKSKEGALPLAASMLRRLRFPRAQTDVIHVLTPMIYDDWGVEAAMSPGAFDSANRAARDMAWSVVNRTTGMLRETPREAGDEPDPALVHAVVRDAASAVEGILAQADQEKADLIAVDGPHCGPMAALLTGSVARSLVIASHVHSVLLAKEPRIGPASEQAPSPKDGVAIGMPASDSSLDSPVRVVFATDHSPYANRCLHKFLHLSPRGISHLTVLTAYPEKELSDDGIFLPDLAIHPSLAVRRSLIALNAEVLNHLMPMLEAAGATSESRVVGAPINDAIVSTMEETKADLLVMGARGHGFAERLSPGTVSFHQAMTSPYSLLMLRS